MLRDEVYAEKLREVKTKRSMSRLAMKSLMITDLPIPVSPIRSIIHLLVTYFSIKYLYLAVPVVGTRILK